MDTSEVGAGASNGSVKAWLESAALVAAVFTASLCVATPIYETNDDLVFAWIVSGRLYGEPVPYLQYQNILIGQGLCSLYRLTTALPWYPLYLIGAQALAWLLVARGLLYFESRPRAYALFATAFLLFGAPQLYLLQFTSTALLLGLSAAFFYAQTRWSEGAGLGAAALAGCALGFSGLIRTWTALQGALLFGLPLLILAHHDRRRFRRLGVFAATLVLVYGGATVIDVRAYSGPEWQDWFRFQRANYNIIERTIRLSPELDAGLRQQGWTRTDLLLATAQYRTDAAMYSGEAMEQVAAVVKRHWVKPTFTQRFGVLVRLLIQDAFWELFGLFFLGIYAVVSAGDRSDRLRRGGLIAAMWLYCFCGFFGVSTILEHLPARVLRPSLAAPLFFTLALLRPRPSELSSRARPRLFKLVGLVLLITAALGSACRAFSLRDFAAVHRSEERAARAIAQRLQAYGDDALFLKCSELALTGFSPFDNKVPKLNLLLMGWPSRSPPWLEALRRRGITDLSRALAHDPKIFLVAHPLIARQLKEYMRRRYEIEVDVRPEFVISERSCVFAVRARPDKR